MEFTEDFIQETGLTPEQAEKVIGFTNDHISEIENSWSGKANQNAEKILDGAAKTVEDLTGIKREKGQKIADYLKSASDNYFKGQRSTLERKEQELEDKLKNSGHNDTLMTELNQTKEQLNKLKEKEAQFSDWEENDYKGKYETTSSELNGLKLDLAFNQVKPKFHENINKYESDYKWQQFKNSILEKYEIKLDNGVAIAVDKENEYKSQKLDELVTKDKELSSLITGQNKGLGSKPRGQKIDGVPFELPENATSKERTQAIKEYLASKGLKVTDSKYSKEFAELNRKILTPKTA